MNWFKRIARPGPSLDCRQCPPANPNQFKDIAGAVAEARTQSNIPAGARMSLPRLAPLATALLCLSATAQDGAPPTQTIVVTATRHAMLALDAPAAMSVVTRAQIEARGADNVLDALRGETGVSLQGRSIGGRKVISLRGMDSKHTLFLVDGQRIGASDGVIGHSDFQYDWIAVDDIERIEVVRGPLSVLYGSEAMGGVVNVITRQAGDRWRGSVQLRGQQRQRRPRRRRPPRVGRRRRSAGGRLVAARRRRAVAARCRRVGRGPAAVTNSKATTSATAGWA